MRAVTSCCLAVLLIGCGKSGEKPADTGVGSAPAMAEEPAGTSLADMAGTWNIRSTLDGSDKSGSWRPAATAWCGRPDRSRA
jgi:hypothetical protein